MIYTAKDISKKAITIEAIKNMSDVRDTMLRYNISRVVIVNNDKPVGMITEKSIARYLYKENNKALDEVKASQGMRDLPISVTGDATIDSCAKTMLDNDISSLLVLNSDINIITKSDLVRVYAENFTCRHSVMDFMRREVHTLSPTHSLYSVLKILIKEHVSRVVIVKDNNVVGIITSRDLMPITSFVEGEREELEDLSSLGHLMIAREIMKKPITIEQTEDLAKASQIMIDKRISGLPVVDSNNHLVGVITKTDIVKALMQVIIDTKQRNKSSP